MLNYKLKILFYIIKHKKNKKSLMGLSHGRNNHKTKLLPTSSFASFIHDSISLTMNVFIPCRMLAQYQIEMTLSSSQSTTM
jgi:hypothetical protein